MVHVCAHSDGVKRSLKTRVKIDLVHKTVSRQRAVSKLLPAFNSLLFTCCGGDLQMLGGLNTLTHTDRPKYLQALVWRR